MTLAERVSAFLNPPRGSEVEIIESKAALGVGAWVMENHEPISRGRRDRQKFMKEAQSISRRNPWVNTAEGIIIGKASTVQWHLEDGNSDTLDEEHPGDPVAQAIQTLLEKPNPQMTRSRLWSITLRHMGVCGNAFWYLDQRDRLLGLPTAIYYINPARMRPATDKQGNLTGWVLDAEDTYEYESGRQTGVGLELEEVIHFTLETPDWGYLGHGLIEAAENLLSLHSAAERYLTQTMTSGGRRGHFIMPKDGRMDDDVFQSLVAGLRNVSESPDAAKRNIVTKGPIETQPQAMNANEVGASGILTMMREDIVSGVWRVPLASLGVPTTSGLNSGDARKYDDASLWQNAIEPRLHSLAETIQFHLIDRAQRDLSLVLELPTFDDNAPAWEILAKSREAPVTWNEQRQLVGLDPLPDYDGEGLPLGLRITMPLGLTQVAQGPDAHGGFAVIPEPPKVLPPEQPLLEPGPQKATTVRGRLEATMTPKLRASVSEFLHAQRDELLTRLASHTEHLLRKPGDTSWWSGKHWDDALAKALSPKLLAVAETAASHVEGTMPRKAEPFIDNVLAFVRKRTGDRITGINETTRDDIVRTVRVAVGEAVGDGLAPSAAAQLIRERVGAMTTWSPERAELISRTELMNAYNDAALSSYSELDVTEVEALDGDDDEECAERNGQVYPIEQAMDISDHPNGTLDWAPVLAAKADPVAEMKAELAELRTAVATRPVNVEMTAPPVTFEAGAFQIHPADVTVHPAEINVHPSDVTIHLPSGTKKLIRDGKGQLVGMTDG